MDTRPIESRADELMEDCERGWGPVHEVLENGDNIGIGNWSAVFYNPEVMEDAVVKVFSGEQIENIRNRIERVHSEYFPASAPIVCDTTEIENPQLLVKQEDTALVIQEKSDESIVDGTCYEKATEEVTEFVDSLVDSGQILDDFKTEAVHRYGDGLKYIDFEDREAIKDWPLHEDRSTNGDVAYGMALMYAKLSAGLHKEYDRGIEEVKDRVADHSEVIQDRVYEEKGFVPEMIDGWYYP